MDKRVTVSAAKDFLPLLQQCAQEGKPVFLIVDEGGLRREEGRILRLDDAHLWLENHRVVSIERLAAVNGVFIDSYAQC